MESREAVCQCVRSSAAFVLSGMHCVTKRNREGARGCAPPESMNIKAKAIYPRGDWSANERSGCE